MNQAGSSDPGFLHHWPARNVGCNFGAARMITVFGIDAKIAPAVFTVECRYPVYCCRVRERQRRTAKRPVGEFSWIL